MDTYRLFYTYSNISIDDAFKLLGNDIAKAMGEGYVPMGNPTVALKKDTTVLTLFMKKEERNDENQR